MYGGYRFYKFNISDNINDINDNDNYSDSFINTDLSTVFMDLWKYSIKTNSWSQIFVDKNVVTYYPGPNYSSKLIVSLLSNIKLYIILLFNY